MTDIRAAQRAYDAMLPPDTFTMQFYASIGQGPVDVLAFAEVWEHTGEVICINEVILDKVDISGALVEEQIVQLMKEAQNEVNKRTSGYYD
jgi:hypothetical protein